MFRRLLALLLATFIFSASPALASPLPLGIQLYLAGTGGTQVLTTTNACTAGKYIWLFVIQKSSTTATPSSVTDTAGNTYTNLVATSFVGSVRSRTIYAPVTTTLASGDSITVIFNDAAPAHWIGGMCIDNLMATPLDLNVAGASATGTAPTITTGTFTQADETVPLAFFVNAGASATVTTDGSWAIAQRVDSTDTVVLAYQTVAATTPITYTGTISTSLNWGLVYTSFKANPPAGGFTPRLLTLGVGQ